MPESKSIFFGTTASRLRWLVLLLIVSCAFGIDGLLKRDISHKVSDAWLEACDKNLSTLECMARVESHHQNCFDLSYTSMMLTFGRQRWESFKLIDYEACMNRSPEPGRGEISI